jgi:BirA family biotin operon repressor/biotin-[acetyl-CoA-carboxylase] ligase
VRRDLDDDLTSLAKVLETRSLGRVHEHHEVLSSTNDRALKWAREGAPEGALVTADEQTGGRGRHGRTWSSPPGDLYASLVLRPDAPPERLGALGLAVAVGLREALVPVLGGIVLKWPNDLLVHGKKLAGILCETQWQGGCAAVVVGFGVNVRTRSFPFDLALPATSLALALEPQPAPGRALVLARILACLEEPLERYLDAGFTAIRGRYEPHLEMLGERVRISGTAHDGIVVAERIDDDGALIVRPVDGDTTMRIDSADVWLSSGPDD